MKRAPFLASTLFIAAACGHQPPADFAPDPALVAQIRSIQIMPGYSRVCPGAAIPAQYEAVLADGTHIPFVHSYDEKHPPRLHVNFLALSSDEARSRSDGSWVSAQDPLLSASTGFRLTATLRAKPSIGGSVSVQPDYSCAPHAFEFEGLSGGRALSGDNGPPVTVTLARARSPFYEKLIVVGIQVGAQAPFYELYDAASIPPADFIGVTTRGGHGGAGVSGPPGGDGAPGASGCPAQAGGAGGDGGYGGPGAPGGRGGVVTVVVPADEPFMAGLVTAREPGGNGGPGGVGGNGGLGGRGGQGKTNSDGTKCADASEGAPGRKGLAGPVGSEGPRGPRTEIVAVPTDQLFGQAVPQELLALVQTRTP